MYTQRTLIRMERAFSVLKSCIPIGQFQCKVNGYARIDQWDYRILKLRGHVRHESMSTGCTYRHIHARDFHSCYDPIRCLRAERRFCNGRRVDQLDCGFIV